MGLSPQQTAWMKRHGIRELRDLSMREFERAALDIKMARLKDHAEALLINEGWEMARRSMGDAYHAEIMRKFRAHDARTAYLPVFRS